MSLIIGYSLAIVVLLALSMFFSSADMAYGSVSLKRLESTAPQGKMSKKAIKLSRNYDKTISTILFFNDTINAGLDTIATLLGIALAVEVFKVESLTMQEAYGLVVSLIVLVFKIAIGEIVAKSFGKIKNYKLARLYSPIIEACYYLTFPINFAVGGFGKIVSYPIVKNIQDIQVSDDSLHEMIDESEENGYLDEEKAEILRGAVDYATTEAYEIMTPRAKVYAVEKERKLSSIMNDEKAFSHSRIPVYEGSIDNVIGFVRLKSLIRQKLDSQEESIASLIEPVRFFPRTVEINDIFSYFKKEKKDFAMVLDEYGGLEGVITQEDIMEEVVGEIWDETDDPEEPLAPRGENAWIVDGGMNLEDFLDEMEIDYEDLDTEYVTVGGFLLELFGETPPNPGDACSYKGLNFEILALGRHKTIRKAVVTKKREEAKDD